MARTVPANRIHSVPGQQTLELRVFLKPKSHHNAILGFHEGVLSIALTAPAHAEQANQQLRRFLAKHLGLPKRAIQILRGHHSRQKVLRIQTTLPALTLANLIETRRLTGAPLS